MDKKYVCGCDVGSTYGKAVIMDLDGNVVSSSIVRSKMDPEETSKVTIAEALKNVPGIAGIDGFTYMVGTGYGRNRVPFADENISEISCHAMGVHVVNPKIRTIIDIGGQDVKGISVDADGSVKNFAMNDKCAAGTGKFLENIARTFEMNFEEFSKLSLQSKQPIPITAQCSVFAESEVISLIAQKKNPADIASGILLSMAKRCYTMLLKAGIEKEVTITGGAAKNQGLIEIFQTMLKFNIAILSMDPQLMGALGAAELARRKVTAKAKATA